MAKKRASARRERSPRVSGVKLARRGLEVGDRLVPLYSGAMHYWRLDRSDWRAGLEQLRDLGLPMVETYVPWQVHERGPGDFDFGEENENLDVGAFVDLAHELELLVFVRPGPHINAEMTYFGLPERIVYDAACQARSAQQNPVIQSFPPRMFPVPSYASRTFLDEVGTWFDAVGETLKSRVWPRGPIVMLQIDNEASYYFRDGPYDQDYHPDARTQYRAYLEKRYGTLARLSEAHAHRYARWDEVEPPVRFKAENEKELVPHLDWVAFREALIAGSLEEMKARLGKAGLDDLVTVHNFPLGDQGVAISAPGIGAVVDLVGFDYYHARREHRTIKRRTLYLAGTTPLPYAPELGVGAPAWFTPLANEDSLFTALTALAYGLRGFNLYMAVDRDRWYGAPIDAQGTPRVDAGTWKHLIGKLEALRFHTLTRRAEVALMMPREYGWLSKATSLLGVLSPTVLEAVTGTPVIACRSDTFGFDTAVQVAWWTNVARLADALTEASVPYVYVDGEVNEARLERYRVLYAPSFEMCDPARWKRVSHYAQHGGAVLYGPTMPSLDLCASRTLFEVPHGGDLVDVSTDERAREVVSRIQKDLVLARPFAVRPSPLETTVHEDENGPRVLFVINPEKQAHTAHISVPTAVALEDVMTGERFAGHTEISLPVRGWTCRMLEITGAADENAGNAEAVAS